MENNITTITKVLFNQSDVTHVDPSALQQFSEKYPYAAIGYFLKAHQSNEHSSFNESLIQRASIYTHNPFWLNYWMKEKNTKETPLQSILNAEVDTNTSMDSLVFEPYHTIDYFASQGIKISKEDLEKDPFGQQLKCFTDWLKSMKKIPAAGHASSFGNDSAETEKVASDAATSITGTAIDTEAMAAVWVKQGKIQQAIHIYQKLSLLNPDKSHYFASKIENLKSL